MNMYTCNMYTFIIHIYVCTHVVTNLFGLLWIPASHKTQPHPQRPPAAGGNGVYINIYIYIFI